MKNKAETAIDVSDDTEDVFDDEKVAQLKKKTVSGAASYMIRTTLLHGLSIVSVGVLAAYLTEADVGIYGIVLQIVGLLAFFSDIGFGSALIQKKTEPTLTEYRTVFTVQQLLAATIFIITVGIAASGVLEPKIGHAGAWVLIALGFSFPAVTLKTISSVMLERKLDFGTLVIPQVVEQVLYNGVLMILAVQGFGVMAYCYAILARTIAGVALMFYLQPWSMGVAFDRQAFKDMIGSGVKFQLNDFLARIKDQLFYLGLGLYLPPTQFGYISLAKLYSQMPYQLTVQNVISITFPTYARLQNEPKLLQRAIEKTLFFITLLIFPLLVGMSVFIAPLTGLIPKYAKWQPAIFTFVMFTLSIGWGAISTPLTNTLNAIGHINTTLKLMIMWTVLTWVLTPLCVWWFGFNGVAIATGLISFSSIVPVYLVKQYIELNVWSQVWRQLLASVVMSAVGVAGMTFWSRSLWWLLLGMMLSGLTYVVVMGIIGYRVLVKEISSLRHKAT